MKHLSKCINEGTGSFPKGNILCPATTMVGDTHIIIGEPFTIKDKAGHKKALKIATSICPAASEYSNLDDFEDMYSDDYGFDLAPDDEIVFVFVPADKSVYTTLLDDLTIIN